MDRQIVICMDGTGNEIRRKASNVLKIYRHLKKDDAQIVHYVPGVGTRDGQTLIGDTWQRLKSLAGLGFGLGLEDDVLDAYRFLSRCYRSAEAKRRDWQLDQDRDARLRRGIGVAEAGDAPPVFLDDRIYLVGFSRGAYAARVLAGFIHNFGLLPPDRLHMAAQVFRAYRRLTEDPQVARTRPPAELYAEMRLYGRVLDPDVSVSIRALGLFDTVSSMIRFHPVWRNLARYRSLIGFGRHAGVSYNTSVRIVRHAMSVDERRSMFRSEHWVPSDFYPTRFRNSRLKRLQYCEQRWFPGYHADIGGAVREQDSGIGKLTALWMLDGIAADEAAAEAEDNRLRADAGDPALPRRPLGLALKRGARARYFEGATDSTDVFGKPYAGPDGLAPLHPSLTPGWWIFEIIPKSLKRREWKPGRPGLVWYFPLGEPRLVPHDHIVDPTVIVRRDAMPLYRPPNISGRDTLPE
ncbi:T6SS phospholipase effector Tle1-like catalytic domain-containing protein [Roseisalinus antarcticus]|uniref:T6SS Phospholipase effector Tle1-like catalytic domain-containing protein n=1 Tax=Roseisalinus antarcticus TaxID=254357 RepID=A0A1Y5RBL0_9RHOB|nr:DUF2235 domain-containing protein [Roseisalinus antarcticus]SLN13631.1 hypothetical protein ROA7023_00066 [Roseisalinus antarcticus]